MKIRLIPGEGEIIELELNKEEADKVIEASVVLYDTRHYSYRSNSGGIYQVPTFWECKPVALINKR